MSTKETIKIYDGEVKQMNCASMIREYLQNNGYDGLYQVDSECACDLSNLMPCGGEYVMECQPGYKVEGCTDACGMGCDYHIAERR